MKRWLGFCLLLFLLLFTGAARARPQSVASADLHVMVKDPQGAVVKNARVVARDAGRNIERFTAADTDGQYKFLSLPPGSSRIRRHAFAESGRNGRPTG